MINRTQITENPAPVGIEKRLYRLAGSLLSAEMSAGGVAVRVFDAFQIIKPPAERSIKDRKPQVVAYNDEYFVNFLDSEADMLSFFFVNNQVRFYAQIHPVFTIDYILFYNQELILRPNSRNNRIKYNIFEAVKRELFLDLSAEEQTTIRMFPNADEAFNMFTLYTQNRPYADSPLDAFRIRMELIGWQGACEVSV